VNTGSFTKTHGTGKPQSSKLLLAALYVVQYVPFMYAPNLEEPLTGDPPTDASIVTPNSYHINVVKDNAKYYSYAN
jgi:hypothetical protein